MVTKIRTRSGSGKKMVTKIPIVNIEDNDLDCEDPETLMNIEIHEKRGVTLHHDC